ncbi:DUF488 domain-containing protein [Pelagicoccus sp. SDUM812002]|uniref:DUF488 domain-containing protein n=1 Tax=Pelagicoccus sp. SDUM812002 TaxID=3041266 RepID=UPI00280EDAC3|nr:DUF488 domain-containing protein [Pelagicoccus sp. SDUM812002]MDQ8186805.1 DUF488 domain-containing protein [Pelagicoccus sp. SDUM812002]
MIYQRQKLLLSLLKTLGGEVKSTDFQKLLFLFTKEHEEEPSYEFVPYKFGCFSFTSYADKRKLTEKGYLEDCEGWKLAKEGPKLASFAQRQGLFRLNKNYGSKRGSDLVSEVYTRYPETAWRSEIIDKVIDDPSLRRRIRNARPSRSGPGLATIGYEGKTLEGYLNLLLEDGVTTLCDVRRNPLSRKYGFSKGALSSACESLGIRYEHLPQLGIASDQRRELHTQADYDALFEEYERDNLPRQTDAVETISSWIKEGERVALTCYEHAPHQCHRHCVAEAVEHQIGGILDLCHL